MKNEVPAAEVHDNLDSRVLDELRREFGEAIAYVEPPSRVLGGFETEIYAFRLAGAPEALRGPLILRMYREDADPSQAAFEAAVQNAVTGAGYPAPRAVFVSSEPGLQFQVMERLPGWDLLTALRGSSFFRVRGLLAKAQARLHELEAATLLAAIERARPLAALTVDSELADQLHHIERASLLGLRDAHTWLLANRPPEGRQVICHGDFHPLNLMVDDGQLSGVIDWSLVRIAEAEYDVGATIALISQGPVAVPAFLRPLLNVLRGRLVSRHVKTYRRMQPVGDAKLRYFEAMRCLGFLIEGGEARQADAGAFPWPAGRPKEWAPSHVADRVVARFRRLTGITPSLPPAAR